MKAFVLFLAVLIITSFTFSACLWYKPSMEEFIGMADNVKSANWIEVETFIYKDDFKLRENVKQYQITDSVVVVTVKCIEPTDSLFDENKYVIAEYKESLSVGELTDGLPVYIKSKINENYFKNGEYRFVGNEFLFDVPQERVCEYLNTDEQISDLSVAIVFNNTHIISYTVRYALPSGNSVISRCNYKYPEKPENDN